MNLGVRESVALARGVVQMLRGQEKTPEVVLMPSFTALAEVHKALARTRVKLGAQNVGTAHTGAFTGEVSPAQLEDTGCAYVLIGHSERRQVFMETPAIIRDRFLAALESRLVPVLCIGETKEDRSLGRTQEVLTVQLASALPSPEVLRGKRFFIAYEPVWAIGSGVPARVADVLQAHGWIRDALAGVLHHEADDIPVLYGGSVDAQNAYTFLRERAISGLLVGGSSLKPQQFQGILDRALEVLQAQD